MRHVVKNKSIDDLLQMFKGHQDLLGKLPTIVDTRVNLSMAFRDERLEGLSVNIQELNQQVKIIDDEIDSLHRYNRMGTLLIDGLILDDNKSLKENVIDEIYRVLNVTLFNEDIQLVSRFGLPNGKEPPKSIRVVFYDPEIKNNLMAMKGRLRPNDIYFKEYLTPKQLDLYIQAKRAQKNDILYNAWSKNGLVYATETENGEVGRLSDLQALVAANLVFDRLE